MFDKLILDPKSSLTFELNPSKLTASSLSVTSSSEPSSKCVLTIRHPGNGKLELLAFKVQTTNPRRYLVRPKQGLIAPYEFKTVTIFLTEKEQYKMIEENSTKNTNVFRSKDKFLIQSSFVSPRLFDKQQNYNDSLSILWSTISKFKCTYSTLQVRHVIVDFASSNMSCITDFSHVGYQKSTSSLQEEISSLQKKCTDLASFTDHLMVERDLLNNAIQGAKLSIQQAKNGISQNARRRNLVVMMSFACVMIILCFGIGIWCSNNKNVDPWWCHVPILLWFF